jgi:hypothetical protein
MHVQYFIFDTDQAQINSVLVVQQLCNWPAASIEAPEDVFPVHEVGNQDQVCAPLDRPTIHKTSLRPFPPTSAISHAGCVAYV